MTFRTILTALLVCLCVSTNYAQTEGDAKGVTFGREQITRWQVGVIVKAVGGHCKGIYGTIPVPTDWPEQEVRVVEEDVSRSARVKHRDLGGVKQMLVQIPLLRAGQTAKALFTYEIRRREINPPPNTTVWQAQRTAMRAEGQQLMAVLMQYATRSNGGEAFLEEGERLAVHYGEVCHSVGLSLVETVRAFILVRRSISDSVYEAGALAGPPDAETWRLYDRTNHFLDTMLLTIVDAFDQARRRQTLPESGSR